MIEITNSYSRAVLWLEHLTRVMGCTAEEIEEYRRRIKHAPMVLVRLKHKPSHSRSVSLPPNSVGTASAHPTVAYSSPRVVSCLRAHRP